MIETRHREIRTEGKGAPSLEEWADIFNTLNREYPGADVRYVSLSHYNDGPAYMVTIRVRRMTPLNYPHSTTHDTIKPREAIHGFIHGRAKASTSSPGPSRYAIQLSRDVSVAL